MKLRHHALRIHPSDDVAVALRDLAAGEEAMLNDTSVIPIERIAHKHKVALRDIAAGSDVTMYGVVVGYATRAIPRGGLVGSEHLAHRTTAPGARRARPAWSPPDISPLTNKFFLGYRRADGRAGTANHWLIVPMVFCDNQKILKLREALIEELGYAKGQTYRSATRRLLEARRRGERFDLQEFDELVGTPTTIHDKPFPNVTGIKLLTHSMGCGGTPDDARTLAALLAGYIDHPNVAGATVLSLGCQHAQVSMLHEALAQRNPSFDKPLFVIEHQREGTEARVLGKALLHTFDGLEQANAIERSPCGLEKLVVGVECGASDGFSGISANPAIGYVADQIVALGASVLLSEFPELCGVEQELCDRCIDDATADRFLGLMRAYAARLAKVGAGFDMNPSPGNIRDGLITDAMKSAGAARKGGTSPIVSVLDYTEPVRNPGLSLLCTPGHDVESTTALVGSGANLVLFSTGLGTPIGNPIAPVIKISTNTDIFRKMPDALDFDAGPIVRGEATVEEIGERLLSFCIEVASGNVVARADALGQDDFIPWKRGPSL